MNHFDFLILQIARFVLANVTHGYNHDDNTYEREGESFLSFSLDTYFYLELIPLIQ